MFNLIELSLPYLGVLSHILLVILVFSIIFRSTWGRGITGFVGIHAIPLAFSISLLAVLGSLFYSEILGFEPCSLCWWQRIFLYPIPLILGIAWRKKLGNTVFTYVIPLAVLATIIALYHTYADLGGASILECTSVGGACSKVYVKEFGYITIPSMSLTISVYILVIAWIRKIYDKNSNSR